MGLLSMLGIGTGGEDPRAVEQRNAAAAAMQQQAQIAYLNQLREDQLAKDAKLEAKDPTATREAALSSLNSIFAPEYQSSYIPDTLTDPFEKAAYDKQFGAANELVDNMVKRGVLTGTGAAAARQNLTDQGARVRGQLNDIAGMLLGSEREKLGNIEGRARERASTLGVNEAFDPTGYSTALGNEVANFSGGLSDLYAGQVPDNLFDTSTLASIGGAKQGAGAEPLNTAGFVAPSDEEDTTTKTPKKKTSVSVF